MIVFTAFWLFDTQMQFEATISLTINRNVQIAIGAPEAELEVVLNDEDDDDDDDDDGIDDSIDSYSDVSSSSDVSLIEFEDLHMALQEYVNNHNERIAMR